MLSNALGDDFLSRLLTRSNETELEFRFGRAFGPAGLPQEVVGRVYDATTAALKRPDVQEALRKQGVMIIGSSPQQAAPFFATELAKHGKLAQEAGLTLE